MPQAGAHEGKAIISVESAAPSGTLAVTYRVRVVWDNDGHPANDATVTAVTANGSATPVAMVPIDADGRYEGAVQFPAAGDWSVRFTVVAPPGTLEVPQVVAPPVTAPPTTAPEITTDIVDPPADLPDASATRKEQESDLSTGQAVWVFLFTVVVVLGGGGLLAWRRRSTR